MIRIAAACLVLLSLAACSNPDKAWELAEREDSNQGYLEFLAKYPDGEFADRARARMAELREERNWERAQFRDRLDNYRRFLGEYPDSQHAAAARARIYELERDQAWEQAVDTDSIAALEGFLSVYPQAPQATEARQRLAVLAAEEPPAAARPPPERPGEFRLQVGAFRTPAAAEAEVRRLSARFADLLRGPVRIITPEESGRAQFLLRTVPMSGAEARASCAALKARGQDCFLVNREESRP